MTCGYIVDSHRQNSERIGVCQLWALGPRTRPVIVGLQCRVVCCGL